MKYTFVPMNRECASTIVDTWKYDGEYSIYDYCNEADHMLDEDGWGSAIFAVFNENRDLVGELSLEFFDEQDQNLDYTDFNLASLRNERQLWIGFGLRPDLIGQGLGPDFVTACVEFATGKYQYRGEFIRLGVAEFNRRAIRAYEKAGFQVYEHTTGEIGGTQFNCVYMKKPLV